MHHYTCFWSGYRQQLSSTPAAVLSTWDKTIPHYGNLLGMVAFGLEELGLYSAAERYGREATAQNPNDLWAVHAVAHVMEMQQRSKDGIGWLDYTLDHFRDFNPFRGHIWWHKGLFLIDAGLFDAALSLYDDAIHDTESAFFLDIQNSVSFWRGLNLTASILASAGTSWPRWRRKIVMGMLWFSPIFIISSPCAAPNDLMPPPRISPLCRTLRQLKNRTLRR
jgi:tetratricopeptide (TPR) repeat protein